MDQAVYRALQASALLQRYMAAFVGATRIRLQCLSAEATTKELSRALRRDPFVAIIMRSREGEAACLKPILRLRDRLGEQQKWGEARTIGGLIHAAVPLWADASMRGLLLAGPICEKFPDVSDCEKVTQLLTNWGLEVRLQQIRDAYCTVPVVSGRRWKSALTLLSLLVNQLVESPRRWLLTRQEDEPYCVTSAKAFIQQQTADLLSLQNVARHVSLSTDHFGKIFRRATSMTLGEYIARIRVERVKEMLPDLSCRVIEAAFAAGFHSVAQFNRVFKKYAGVNPSQYRVSLNRQNLESKVRP
jgi:AraC-like DNA-binding protein